MEGAAKPELRLGLVLYGGVSLAVYIYGVVCEVQRLLSAAAALEAARDGGDERGELPAYAEALRDAGFSGAVVDVIAGTSAGGINGILLAKALAAGADVGEVKDLWIEGGDIGVLMNGVEDPDPASLLVSERFEERLREGFERLDRHGSGPDTGAALDLFVSATHLRGDRREFMDALGRGIESLVHRFVFHLKQRPYGRNDFKGEAAINARLVELCRATSAFPVAFEPVLLEGEALLGPRSERQGWFADGGILNNKPFTEALRTIFTRASPEGPVRRWLLSVDPDPVASPAREGPGPQPGFDQVLGAAVAGIPRYQSIASDLEALEAHNASVKRVARTVLDLEARLAAGGAGAGVGLGAGFDGTYRDLRRRASSQQLAEQLMQAARPTDPASFDPEATEAALAEGALREVVDREEEIGERAEGGFSEEAAWSSDLPFQRRRIYYLIKLLGMSRGPAEGDRERLATARARLWEAFEAVSGSLWQNLAAAELPLGEGDGAGLDSHRQAFEAARARVGAGWGNMRSLGADMAGLGAALEGVSVILSAPDGADGADGRDVAVSLRDVYDSFFVRDFFLLSIEAGGGVRFREIVDHAQISPESATATKVEPGMKLAGDTAGHFGGFLEREWRLNDARWGRLDAAEVLMRVILAGASPERQEEAIEAVCREVLGEDCRAALDSPDWRQYLADNAVGGTTLKSLTARRRTGLTYRAAVVLRGMLARARADAEGPQAGTLRARGLRAVDTGVKRVLLLLFLPRLLLEPRWRRYARETERGGGD